LSSAVQSLDLSLVIQLMVIVGGIIGILGFLSGLYQYRQTQRVKRQQMFFDLIDKFDNPKNTLYKARMILDGFVLPFSREGQISESEAYGKNNLEQILRHHGTKPITDPGEIEIRASFDALLSFLGVIEYLRENSLMSEKEVRYFEDTIKVAAKEKAVNQYIEYYPGFPYYIELIKRYQRNK
jgi:hypothetical protein